MSALLACAEFGAALLLIGFAGSRLSRYGEQIAERSGLGGSWVGLTLLAPVTSLPELITGLSAVGLTESVDIAVGAVLGSCVFNLALIALMDLLLGRESVFVRVRRSHVLPAGFTVILLGTVCLGLLVERQDTGFAFFHLGASSVLVLGLYAVAMRAIYRKERGDKAAPQSDAVQVSGTTNRELGLRFALAAGAVVLAGLWLPFAGMRLASAFQLHETFVGTLFVAFATSVPEAVVTVAALRVGAPNMAFANLLGSNLFNIAILVPEDLLLTSGPILAAASPLHVVSAISAVIMTGIVMVSLEQRPRVEVFRLSAPSLLLVLVFCLNAYLILLYGR